MPLDDDDTTRRNASISQTLSTPVKGKCVVWHLIAAALVLGFIAGLLV